MVVVTEATPAIEPEEPADNSAEVKTDEDDKKQQEEKKLQEEEAERTRKAEEEAAAQTAEVPAEPAPEEPAGDGLVLTFREPGGAKTYTINFKTKPLGMDFNANVKPVKINKVFCAAKALGVQEGSELVGVAGTDVEALEFPKILALLKEKVGPLQPDGLVIIFRDASGQRKTTVFPTQPLGMDFDHNKKPIRIKLVVPGAAHSLGVEGNSEIMSIAGTDVEEMSYDEVLKLLRSQTTTLPTKE